LARSRRGSFGLGLAARSDVAGRGGGATGSPPVRRRRTPAGVEGSVSHRAQPGRPLRGTRSTRHDAKAASLASIAAPHRGSNLGRRSPSQIHNDDETPPRPIAILTMAAATDSTNRDGVRPLRFGRRRGPRHRARGGDRRRRGWVDGVGALLRCRGRSSTVGKVTSVPPPDPDSLGASRGVGLLIGRVLSAHHRSVRHHARKIRYPKSRRVAPRPIRSSWTDARNA